MPKIQTCRGCSAEFISKSKKRFCPECMKLVAAGWGKDIFLIERLRAEFIKKHGRYLDYGAFVNYIKYIEQKGKHE